MESLVDTSRGFVGGNRLVDEKKVRELLDQLRLAVPQDVTAAQELIQKKDSLLQQAQAEAKRTQAQAEEEFKARVEESEIMAEARARADELIEDAERSANRQLEQAETEARNKQAEADAYALQTLRNLERELTNLLGSVKKGVDVLSSPSGVPAD